MKEFVYPDFIANGTTADEIQQKMMNNLPEDIDGMPGGFAYDLTKPTAIEKSDMINDRLVRVIQLMFPDWAWGEWLDLHGKQKNLSRKEPGHAAGYVTITGTVGTELPKGFVLCTPATSEASSVLFSINELATIPESGTITVPVTAVESGTGSNVQPGMVSMMASPIEGIVSITNESAITGGTETESDDDYRERIDDAYKNESLSYIGNDSDYLRWAKSVVGVGDCIVSAAWNGPGTVKLSLIDQNGVPASDSICTAVYNYIVSPNDRSQRLLPTGSATLTVAPAETISINYSCTKLELESGYTVGAIQESFRKALTAYYPASKAVGEVRYNQVHAILTDVAGVIDFADFRMNDGIENIALDTVAYPFTGDIKFEQ